MKLEQILIASYTIKGKVLAERAAKVLEEKGHCIFCIHKPKGNTWLKKYWAHVSQILFIGAAGIAVRMAAPCLKDKLTDPGLVVADEKGKYFIPLLSGHMGGANACAVFLAEALGGNAVLTTATDVQGCFAVDLFAKEQGLCMTRRELVKYISAAILQEEPVGFYSEYPLTGELPKGLVWCAGKEQLETYKYSVAVTDQEWKDADNILCLLPRDLILGIGCKKGTSLPQLEQLVEQVTNHLSVDKRRIGRIASIDLKAGEEGMIALADTLGASFSTYPKEVLQQVETVSEESAFVKKITGIGNVCERAALYESKGDTLLLSKYVMDGMTIAVAIEKRGITFE